MYTAVHEESQSFPTRLSPSVLLAYVHSKLTTIAHCQKKSSSKSHTPRPIWYVCLWAFNFENWQWCLKQTAQRGRLGRQGLIFCVALVIEKWSVLLISLIGQIYHRTFNFCIGLFTYNFKCARCLPSELFY